MFYRNCIIILVSVMILGGIAVARDFDTLPGVQPQLRYFFDDLADTEVAAMNGATAGTAVASKAMVLDANKDIVGVSDIRADTYTAGYSGSAGAIDIYPTTALKGKLEFLAADNSADYTVTLTNASHGQATTISLPDVGLATSHVVQATNAITAAEADFLDGGTAGTTTDLITATYGVTAAQSGATLFLNNATGKAVTLPAPAAGLRYKFVVKTQPTSGNMVIGTNAAAAIIEGMVDVNNVKVPAANEKQVNIVASTALVGDWVSVVSDGTSWFLTGESAGGAGAITVTAP